jgi:hypothetical protein
MLIDTSLTLCVLNIAQGGDPRFAHLAPPIPQKAVTKIVTGRLVRTDEEFDALIAELRKTWWSDLPAQCERIARELRIEGKIEFSRLTRDNAPRYRNGSHWVTDERFIQWMKPRSRAIA